MTQDQRYSMPGAAAGPRSGTATGDSITQVSCQPGFRPVSPVGATRPPRESALVLVAGEDVVVEADPWAVLGLVRLLAGTVLAEDCN